MLSTVLSLAYSTPSVVQHLVAVQSRSHCTIKCVDLSDVKACGGECSGPLNVGVGGVTEYAEELMVIPEVGSAPRGAHANKTKLSTSARPPGARAAASQMEEGMRCSVVGACILLLLMCHNWLQFKLKLRNTERNAAYAARRAAIEASAAAAAAGLAGKRAVALMAEKERMRAERDDAVQSAAVAKARAAAANERTVEAEYAEQDAIEASAAAAAHISDFVSAWRRWTAAAERADVEASAADTADVEASATAAAVRAAVEACATATARAERASVEASAATARLAAFEASVADAAERAAADAGATTAAAGGTAIISSGRRPSRRGARGGRRAKSRSCFPTRPYALGTSCLRITATGCAGREGGIRA